MQNSASLASERAFLQSIADNGYQLPEDIDAFTFASALLQNFSSADSHLREELTYMMLVNLIFDQKQSHRLSATQREALLLTCLDADHLFFHIGEAGTDSVFIRSFSLLAISLLLNADAKLHQFSKTIVRNTLETLLRYGSEERDWRGYVKGKGWAHSVAHLSDTLDDSAQHPYATTATREAILQALPYLATLPEPLAYEEDERLAYVAYRIIARQQVEQPFLERWLDSFLVKREHSGASMSEHDVLTWVKATNAKNFMRSLYFHLLWYQKGTALLERISETLKQLDGLPAEWFRDEQPMG